MIAVQPRLVLAAAGTALVIAVAVRAANRRRDCWLIGPAIAALEPEEAAEMAPSLRKAVAS